ncbi:MAG: Uma2 family endonuclease [Chloroflexota bacterium]
MKKLLTAEESLLVADKSRPFELVRGEIVYMDWTGEEHADVAGELFGEMRAYVREHDLGKVYTADAGFLLAENPDTVRVPDVAFVSWARRGRVEHTAGAVPMPPDLAVEIISPSDTMKAVREKVKEYFEAGVQEVWIIEPWAQTVTKCLGSLLRTQTLGMEDMLDGGELLPGFTMRVAELFSE